MNHLFLEFIRRRENVLKSAWGDGFKKISDYEYENTTHGWTTKFSLNELLSNKLKNKIRDKFDRDIDLFVIDKEFEDDDFIQITFRIDGKIFFSFIRMEKDEPVVLFNELTENKCRRFHIQNKNEIVKFIAKWHAKEAIQTCKPRLEALFTSYEVDINREYKISV